MTLLRRAFAGCALVVVLAGLGASPAHAQAAPTAMSPTRCADANQGDSGLGGGGNAGGGSGGGGGGSWGGPATTTATTRAPSPADLDRKENEEHGLCDPAVNPFAIGPDPGPYPTSHYDLGYDAGGSLSMWRKLNGWLMDSSFAVGASWFVRGGIGIVNWVMPMGIADALEPTATTIGEAYRTNIIGPIDLGHVTLFICVLWAAFLAMTGRLLRGAAELGLSLLIGSIGVVLWANPGTSLVGALHWMGDFGNEIAAASTGQAGPPSNGQPVSASMSSAIHRALVEQPHQWLDWGRPIPAGDPCRATYDAAIASGPWGAADEPRDAMKAAGCNTEANYNHDPTNLRVVGAVVIAAGDALVMVLLLATALTLLAAQIAIMLAIVTAHLAFVLGALPGRTRALFWRWCAGTAIALTGVLLAYGLLALVLGGISAVLSSTNGMGVVQQMLVVDVIAGYGLIKRRAIIKGGRTAVQGFAQRMASAQIGGAPLRRGQVSWGQIGGGAVAGAAAATAWQGARSTQRTWDSHQRRSYQRDTRAYQKEMRDNQRTGSGPGHARGWQEMREGGTARRVGPEAMDAALNDDNTPPMGTPVVRVHDDNPLDAALV